MRQRPQQQQQQQPPPQQQPEPQQQPQPEWDSLHAAAARGDTAALRRLLAGGAAAQQLDAPQPESGRTPLHIAASLGHLAAAEALLLTGADANAGDATSGAAPLHSAAEAGDAAMVQLLLNHGADAAACDRSGRTACHSAAAGCSAGSASAALLCLARAAPRLLSLEAHSCCGNTPLHVLCCLPEAQCLPNLQALASCGLLTAAALDIANAAGWPPLALSAAAGSAAVVELLLRCGASHSPSSTSQPACGSEQQHGTQQYSPRQAATMQVCPLGAAAAGGHYSCLLPLLRAGAGASRLSCCVLEQACRRGRADVAAALLAAGLSVSGAEAQQLLVMAVDRGDEALLAALLDHGLDPNCPGDAHGAEGLLHAALRPGREALLRCLLGLQADGRPELACGTFQTLDVAALAERLQANPLLHAVRRSSPEGMSCLLAAGCPPGAVPAGTGLPPLMAAASRLDAARCRLLIPAKALAWETDRQGQSALDAVLSLCTDAQLIQLTAEETQGAAATTEQELLQLVEMLVQAGAPCNRFLTEHWPAAAAAAGAACLAGAASTTACVAGAAGPAGTATMNGQRPPALVFPSLLLAAGLPSWSPRAHRQWPPAFCSAAREALLVLRARGVAAAAERAGGGQTHMQHGGAAGQQARLHLPVEICHLILQKAASVMSCWVGP